MKLVYKPLDLLLGALGGILAGAVFKRVWRAMSGEDEAPDATSPEHRTRKVLLAAMLEGAIFAGIKAALHRAGAKGYHVVTGRHPQS